VLDYRQEVNLVVPLYEYMCKKDGRFELIRKFSDPPLKACPTCGRKVEKLLSSPAIQFKGTGWYITDYARKSSGDGKSQSSDSKSGDSKSGEGKSDAKPVESGKGSSGDTSKSAKDASSAPPATAAKGGSTSGSGSSK